MNAAAGGLLLEALLRAALKTSATLRIMDAENRKIMTEEEEAAIQQETDLVASKSRAIGDQL